MKVFKRLSSILLAVCMVIVMALPAMAEEPAPPSPARAKTTITAPEGTRKYEIYQIFRGDMSSDTLSNIVWGKNGTGKEGTEVDSDTIADLQDINDAKAAPKTDLEKINIIKKYVNFESTPVGTVSNGSSLEVDTGYYLFKDIGTVGQGEAYSMYVVNVVGPTTIKPKTGNVTSQKKVDDKNDSNSNEDATDWKDSADYDIGDYVPFRIEATLPEGYRNYEKYKLIFHDQQSAGLTFDANSVEAYVGANKVTSGYRVDTHPTDGCTFHVVFEDLKQSYKTPVPGTVIAVEYKSQLTGENVVIGRPGNPNTMHVEYSNNPHNENETGTTPSDKVVVFTYNVTVNKVDPDGNPLTGAAFRLEKQVLINATAGTTEWQPVKEYTVDETNPVSTFVFNGLDAGKYRLVETVTPDGYNTIKNKGFEITADHDLISDDPKLTDLSATSGDDISFTANMEAGSLTTQIINHEGSVLPETGGMGTTIFYIIGGIMVIGSGILLVTRRRVRR